VAEIDVFAAGERPAGTKGAAVARRAEALTENEDHRIEGKREFLIDSPVTTDD